MSSVSAKQKKRASQLKRTTLTLIKSQKRQDYTLEFRKPVDAIALNIPTYYDIIKNPMDLSTIIVSTSNLFDVMGDDF